MKKIIKNQDEDKNLSKPDTETYKKIENFEHLPEKVFQNLSRMGITVPTPIQQDTFEAARAGRDLLAQSHTGSGKTLAFALPTGLALLESKHGTAPRALVLAPTRELAQQVAGVFEKSFEGQRLQTVVIMGGAGYIRQKAALRQGADIVIGTPGRIVDLLEQGALNLGQIQVFILDEVDQMLDIGFAPALEKISGALPKKRQTLFFSATLHHRIRQMAMAMLTNPLEIKFHQAETSKPKIQHGYLEVRTGQEVKALVNALLYHQPQQAIIFCETKVECAEVAEALSQRGFDTAALNSDMGQRERTHTMKRFEAHKLRYLVATNVAARGIDIQNMPLVINMSVPQNLESYVHRSGRTGRAGAEGQAWTLVNLKKRFQFKDIMREIGVKPTAVNIPSTAELQQKLLEGELKELLLPLKASSSPQLSASLNDSISKAIQKLDPEEIALGLKHALTKALNKFSVYDAGELSPQYPLINFNETSSPGQNRGALRPAAPARSFQKFSPSNASKDKERSRGSFSGGSRSGGSNSGGAPWRKDDYRGRPKQR